MIAKKIRVLKVLVFLLCLLPLGKLGLEIFGLAGFGLGANPIEELIHRLGKWGLNFLLITLSVTPLRKWTGWNWLIRFRRMLGLFAFFYALMHFLAWFILDQGMLTAAILEDLIERPFIAIGFSAVLILTALAATSFTAVRRRMGKNWQTLHNMIYAAAILGVWHYWWQVKKDVTEPQIYAAILAVLLGARIVRHWYVARQRS